MQNHLLQSSGFVLYSKWNETHHFIDKHKNLWVLGKTYSLGQENAEIYDVKDPKILLRLRGICEKVSSGSGFTIMIDIDKNLWITGKHSPVGELRDFTKSTKVVVEHISCGSDYFLLVDNNQKLFGCGKNNIGQLGIENVKKTTKVLPVSLIPTGVSMISCGADFSLVLYEKKIFAFGNNNSLQLGISGRAYNHEKLPILIPKLDNIQWIVCGYLFASALDYDGKVYVWGWNYDGVCACPTVDKTVLPRCIENLPKIIKLSVGYYSIWVIDEFDRAWCWGNNYHSQLGIDTERLPITVPRLEEKFTGVTSVLAGFGFSIIQAGSCWGIGYEPKLLGSFAEGILPKPTFPWKRLSFTLR